MKTAEERLKEAETQLEQAKANIEQVRKDIAAQNPKYTQDWRPTHTKEFWYLIGTTYVVSDTFQASSFQNDIVNAGEAYPSEHHANTAKAFFTFWRNFDKGGDAALNGSGWEIGVRSGQLLLYTITDRYYGSPRFITEGRGIEWARRCGKEYVIGMLPLGRQYRWWDDLWYAKTRQVLGGGVRTRYESKSCSI